MNQILSYGDIVLKNAGMTQVLSYADIVARHEREKLALSLLKQLDYLGFAGLFQTEYRFHPERRWRLDLYCAKPPNGGGAIGIELHGGVYRGGRHVTGAGFSGDRIKCNAAVELGIRVLEFTSEHVRNGSAAQQIERIIKSHA